MAIAGTAQKETLRNRIEKLESYNTLDGMPWSTALSHQGQKNTPAEVLAVQTLRKHRNALAGQLARESPFRKFCQLSRSSVRHWWPRCKVAAESSRCRKYSSPPPEYHLNYKKYQKHSSSLKTPGRCPPSTPPYQGIRHSRRNSHQIFGIKIKMCKSFSSTFWWSRDRAIWRMVEVWNCSTRF